MPMAAANFCWSARTVLSLSRSLCMPLRSANQASQYIQPSRIQSTPFAVSFVRYASHQAQGRANGPKNGAGKRLGSKKTGEQFVVPGNIIYRQRGTLWFPGENCAMGRDHTIYATEKGYVKYYKDPERHPKRRYIGVAFERSWTLPTPTNAPRRRRLGMVAMPMKEESPEPVIDVQMDWAPPGLPVVKPSVTLKDGTVLKMRSNYNYREDNWEIGRAAEKAGVRVRPYKKGDRWLAWRKTTARRAKGAELRSMLKKGGKKKKAAAKAKA